MKHAKPGMYEYELEALFKYIAYKNGGYFPFLLLIWFNFILFLTWF